VIGFGANDGSSNLIDFVDLGNGWFRYANNWLVNNRTSAVTATTPTLMALRKYVPDAAMQCVAWVQGLNASQTDSDLEFWGESGGTDYVHFDSSYSTDSNGDRQQDYKRMPFFIHATADTSLWASWSVNSGVQTTVIAIECFQLLQGAPGP
jgi:hypothetical protein